MLRYFHIVLLSLALSACNIPNIEDFQEPEPEPPPEVVVEPTPAVGFTITSLAPNRGAPRGLEVVEIRGGGFRKDSRVFFGGSEVPELTVTSEGRMFAVTPPHSPGRVDVRVVNIDGSVAESKDAYLYFADIVVHAILPPEGPATGGVPIEIRGSGLTGATVVLFDGKQALDVTVIDDTTINAILPAHPVGDADVHILAASGTGRMIDGFRFFAPPTITGLSPLAAHESGGGTLSLAGSGLVHGAEVSIGSTSADVLATKPDGTQLVVRIPAGSVGRADIRVTTQYGSLELPGAFTYLGDDTSFQLLNLWPAEGPASGGGEVILVATGLDSNADIRAFIGDTEVDVLDVIEGQHLVLVTAPPGEPDTVVDVTLSQDENEATLLDAYRYVPTLAVTGVNPSQGPSVGETELVVTGEGFDQNDIELFIGALPVTELQIISDTEIHARSPMGSPGFANVRVRAQAREGVLPDGFSFVAGETQIFAIVPEQGAIAGNTWVTVYGTDLPPYLSVQLGGVGANFVERVDPTTLVFRSPRAEEVGVADLRVSAGPNFDHTLTEAYTYFDPTARWGGTWGNPIDGSLNVTVLASGSEEVCEGAVVVIGHENPPQYKGYTDDRGQVTLSGPWLNGPVDVSAAQMGASAASILQFDAENVTLFISKPSEPGGGGEDQLAPGNVTGTVHGTGKYLIMPPWECDEISNAPEGYCGACTTDDDCSGTASKCTTVANQPPFCSSTCDLDTDCPVDFACLTASKDEKRCVSSPGQAEARCFISSPSILSLLPASTEDNTMNLGEGENTFILKNLRLGEVAIYCMGGAYRLLNPDTPDERAVFRPTVMGIRRHEFVMPGLDPNTGLETDPLDLDITLDIPLNRSVNLIVGEQPLRPTGPHTTTVYSFLNLGSDGFVPLANKVLAPPDQMVSFSGLPGALTGDLYDAEYIFHGAALSDTSDQLPSSEVLRTRLGSLDEGSYLFFDGAKWSTPQSGYPGDVHGLVARGEDDVFAVTAAGTVIHYDGYYWSPQAVQAGPALNAITRDMAGGVVVVGDAGRVLRWNGAGWQQQDSGTNAALRGVTAIGPDAVVAVGSYVIAEWDGNEWVVVPFGPPKDLRAVWSFGVGSAWAVGSHGATLKRDASSGKWIQVSVPFYDDLHDVWGTTDGLVVAVGNRGQVLMGAADGTFEAHATPTARTLRGVWGRGAGDVYAVGDAATVVHFDGVDWSLITENTVETSLRSIDGAGADAQQLFAMGTHAVHLDPFLKIPDFTSPASGQQWNRQDFAWYVDGGAKASFNSFRIFGPTGALAWSIMTPGELRNFKLPDLSAIEGIPIFTNGQKRSILYRVQHPEFDINDFDNRVFRLMDWRAWVLHSFTFDAPNQDVPTGTVPGN